MAAKKCDSPDKPKERKKRNYLDFRENDFFINQNNYKMIINRNVSFQM